jgi:hypothetical protein
MSWIAPCPTCGLRLRIDAGVCLMRLLALRAHALGSPKQVGKHRIDSFDCECPACHEPLTVPLDSPSAAA